VLDGRITFPWFYNCDAEDANAYSQFISALCATAKERKRVTAKPTDTDNMRFTMRVFCIGLGLIGSEYSRVRALLTKPLPGNGAWRYYQNEKEAEDAAQSEATATELPSTATEDTTTAPEISDDSTEMPDTGEYLTETEVEGDE